ncbi:MAG: tRNA (N(6)-L-threonylcarbamoyladenosine(37)-C(2))-methylthiotransferase MtaB [Planctomycetales bacterium]|nr:tRNA (N(6)-L-threonylcarbamoyladenosine(37)-C(2))-methylthiotransferase MtaB [Planctomycetales bacterium]
MAATLKTVTLGCKVNQYETEYVREGLVGIGYRDAAQEEAADLCIVNTCTVTGEGDSKSRQIIRRLARDNPGTRIVVMGCYATRAPEEVAALPSVAEVVTDKRELPDLLGRFGVVDIPTGISQFGTRHRAYVKVQDGCLLRCSYCIIPKVRPSLYSRPSDHILDEVRRLFDNGFREIVLTGVHLGHYGVDWNAGKPKSQWYRLADLVRQIVAIDGDFRVRLSSIEATEVTRELIAVMGEFPDKVCPHLHICLQSGSDRILRRMKRRWGVKRFLDRCRLVTETLDKPALTTDVIVGFPGETDADFESTCDTVRKAGFSKIHTFPFSPRRGTPAADLAEMVPKRVKAERSQILATVEAELRECYFQRLLGTRLRVLVEGQSERGGNWYRGTSCRYAPVEFFSDDAEESSLVEVYGEQVATDRIIGASQMMLS